MKSRAGQRVTKALTDRATKQAAKEAAQKTAKYGFETTLKGTTQHLAKNAAGSIGLDYAFSAGSTTWRCLSGQNTAFNEQEGILASTTTLMSETYKDFPLIENVVEKQACSALLGTGATIAAAAFCPALPAIIPIVGGGIIGSHLSKYLPDRNSLSNN